jgi:hypothetical protein
MKGNGMMIIPFPFGIADTGLLKSDFLEAKRGAIFDGICCIPKWSKGRPLIESKFDLEHIFHIVVCALHRISRCPPGQIAAGVDQFKPATFNRCGSASTSLVRRSLFPFSGLFKVSYRPALFIAHHNP